MSVPHKHLRVNIVFVKFNLSLPFELCVGLIIDYAFETSNEPSGRNQRGNTWSFSNFNLSWDWERETRRQSKKSFSSNSPKVLTYIMFRGKSCIGSRTLPGSLFTTKQWGGLEWSFQMGTSLNNTRFLHRFYCEEGYVLSPLNVTSNNEENSEENKVKRCSFPLSWTLK